MIDIQINMDDVRNIMKDYASQINYTISTTINNTLKDAQTAMRDKMFNEFTIRRQTFLSKSVKISPFAKKTSLTGTVGIMNLGSDSTADIFSKFEEDGTKTPRGKNIAIPTNIARPNVSSLIRSDKRPKNLAKAFVITTASGQQLLMNRVSRGKYKGVNVMYVLKPSTHLSARLNFFETVTNIINNNLQPNFDKAFAKSIATAK